MSTFKRTKQEVKEEFVGGYVSVKVINNIQLANWYKDQGLETIDPLELHCTIAYSRVPFHRVPNKDEIIVNNTFPELSPLGDEGCVVLKLYSEELENRFKECMEAGATYDYESYIPHITIAVGVTEDLSKYKSPNFDIILGNETIEKLDEEFSYLKEN